MTEAPTRPAETLNRGSAASLRVGAALAQDVAFVPGHAFAVEGNEPPNSLRLNFRGVPLEMVLDYLSRAAGLIIIMETGMAEPVEVWSQQLLNEEEAVNLLNAALSTKGYAALREGRTLTIVHRDEARKRNLPDSAE